MKPKRRATETDPLEQEIEAALHKTHPDVAAKLYRALCRVELPIQGVLGLFTVVAEPTPPWLAASGQVVFAGLVLAFACWRVRRLEVLYSTD